MESDHQHSALFLEWLRYSWQWLAVVISAITGGLWWAMHRVFATHSSQDVCKADLHSALIAHERKEFDRASKAEIRMLDTFNRNREEHLNSHLALGRKIDEVTMIIIDKLDRGHGLKTDSSKSED